MTVEDDTLKELKEQTRFIKAGYGVLNEIKFELQNARKINEMKVIYFPGPDPTKVYDEAIQKSRERFAQRRKDEEANRYVLWKRFWFWLRGNLGR